MTEPQTEGPAGTEDGHPDAPAGDHDPTVHQLAEKVDRLAHMFEQFMEGGGGHAEAEPPDIKAEVRAAVREVQAKEKKKADDEAAAQSIQDQLTELRHKVETPPAEHVSKRSSRVMGWHVP